MNGNVGATVRMFDGEDIRRRRLAVHILGNFDLHGEKAWVVFTGNTVIPWLGYFSSVVYVKLMPRLGPVWDSEQDAHAVGQVYDDLVPS